ncbi:putative membrane protein [Candidatus Phytoplasma solani]|uniref:hypothetical protein n=1 Tax=Candidatus Phytoplasma solani TaxID=69896 RepID=UPI0032DB8EE4
MENKQIYAFTAAIVVSVIVAVSIWFFRPFKSEEVSQTNLTPMRCSKNLDIFCFLKMAILFHFKLHFGAPKKTEPKNNNIKSKLFINILWISKVNIFR